MLLDSLVNGLVDKSRDWHFDIFECDEFGITWWDFDDPLNTMIINHYAFGLESLLLGDYHTPDSFFVDDWS